jgi:hypothetical protein
MALDVTFPKRADRLGSFDPPAQLGGVQGEQFSRRPAEGGRECGES